MTDALPQTLDEVATQVGLNPLEVLAWVSVLGLPCDDGTLDPTFLDIIQDVAGRPAKAPSQNQEPAQESRLEAVQHVLGYLVNAGRYYPAATEITAIVEALQDPRLGEGAIALLERCGLLRRSSGRRGQRVGVNAARRHQVDQLVETGTTEDPVISEWLTGA